MAEADEVANATLENLIICRTCNTECTSYRSLFKQGIIMEELTTLARLLSFCCNMPVEQEDSYMPAHICEDCTQLLAKLYEFKKKVLHTNYMLRKQYMDMSSATLDLFKTKTNKQTLEDVVHEEAETVETVIECVETLPEMEQLELAEAVCQAEDDIPVIDITQDKLRFRRESPVLLQKICATEPADVIAIEPEQLEVSIVPAINDEVLYNAQDFNDEIVTEDEQHPTFITIDNIECEGDIEIESAVEVDEATQDYEMIHIEADDMTESDQYDDCQYDYVEWSQNNEGSTMTDEFAVPLNENDDKPKSRRRYPTSNKLVDPKFKCSVCGKQLSNNNSFKYHMQLHSDKKPFLCSLCGELFKTRNAYDGHITIHNPDNPNKCTNCGKSYRQASSLRAHMLTHTGEKPYVCEICGKGMTQKSGYKKHLLTHTGEKPHTCDICRRSFRYSSNLLTHRRCHSRERPYMCTECNKSFSSSSQLNQHKIVHTGEKPYPCDICGKSFKRRISLTTHKQTHSFVNGIISEVTGECEDFDKTSQPDAVADVIDNHDCIKITERVLNSNLIQVL